MLPISRQKAEEIHASSSNADETFIKKVCPSIAQSRLKFIIEKDKKFRKAMDKHIMANREQYFRRYLPTRFYLKRWANAIVAIDQFYDEYGYSDDEEENVVVTNIRRKRMQQIQNKLNILSRA